MIEYVIEVIAINSEHSKWQLLCRWACHYCQLHPPLMYSPELCSQNETAQERSMNADMQSDSANKQPT